MQIPSIQELASRARDVAKYQNISMRDAINSVAQEYEVDSAPIAKELNRRAGSIKEKKKKEAEREKEEELVQLQKEKLLNDARSHEWQLKRGFMVANHLDDY